MKCQIPALLDRGGGVIVNVASESPFKGNAGDLDYTASKHGVVGLTTAAALQNATRNINGVSPAMSMQGIMEQARRYRSTSELRRLERARPIRRIQLA